MIFFSFSETASYFFLFTRKIYGWDYKLFTGWSVIRSLLQTIGQIHQYQLLTFIVLEVSNLNFIRKSRTKKAVKKMSIFQRVHPPIYYQENSVWKDNIQVF